MFEFPLLWQLHSLDQWLWVLGWCVLLQGLAWALFQSWPAVALQEKLNLKNAAEAHRIRMLHQEVASGRQMLLGQQTPLRKGVVLDPQQVEEKSQELRRLLRASRGKRAIQELLTCATCQRFWVAFAFGLLANGFLASLANAAGFAVLAGSLFTWLEKKGECGRGR